MPWGIRVLDPIGTGASALRTETALRLVKEIQFSVIRENIPEMKALGQGTTKGVDTDATNQVTEDNLEVVVTFVKRYAKETKMVIAVTGAIE